MLPLHQEKGVVVSSRWLHEVVLKGQALSSTVGRRTTASKAQAGTGMGRGTGIDQDLMLLLCARAAQTFSKSSQSQAEIPLNKAVPGQGLSKCSDIRDKRSFNRRRMKELFC